MANVPPEIMNRMRAQLHKGHSSGEISIPAPRRSAENVVATSEAKQEDTEELGRVKGMLSRLALRATGPELTGE